MSQPIPNTIEMNAGVISPLSPNPLNQSNNQLDEIQNFLLNPHGNIPIIPQQNFGTPNMSPHVISNSPYTHHDLILGNPAFNEFRNGKNVLIMDKNIDDNYFVGIARNLLNINEIESFEAKGTRITGVGISYLGDFIAHCPTLYVLRLSNNNIHDSDMGLDLFFPSLAVSPSLKEVDLSSNKLGNRSSVFIANLLKVNQGIQTLDLKFNEITNEGASLILDSLNFNRIVKNIFLTGNKINENIIFNIEQRLELNKNQSKIFIPHAPTNDFVFIKQPDIIPPFPQKIIDPRDLPSPIPLNRIELRIDYEYDKLKKDFKFVDANYRVLLKEFNDLKAKYEDLQIKLSHFKANEIEKGELEKVIEKLNSEMRSKNKVFKSISAENNSKFENEFLHLQGEIIKFKSELEMARNTIIQRDDELSKLKFDFDKCTSSYIMRIKDLESENMRIANEIHATKEKYNLDVNYSNSSKIALEKEIEKLKNGMQNLDSINKNINLAASEKVINLETQANCFKEECNKLKKLYNEAIERIKELEVIEDRYHSLEIENKKLRSEIKSLDDLALKRDEEVKKANSELTNFRISMQNLIDKNNLLEGEIHQLNIGNTNLSRENISLVNQSNIQVHDPILAKALNNHTSRVHISFANHPPYNINY